MATDPDEGRPDDNPFKGTPFEQIFGALGGQGAGGQLPDLSQIFGQLQAMLQPYDGPLNWEVALDLARKTVAATPDPTPTAAQQSRVADAVRLADHWLDPATNFPSGVTTATAWSRAEWVVNTTDVWKILVEPVAQQSVGAMGSALPEECAGPGRTDPRHPRQGHRCAPGQPGRLRHRHAGRGGAQCLRHRHPAQCAWPCGTGSDQRGGLRRGPRRQ